VTLSVLNLQPVVNNHRIENALLNKPRRPTTPWSTKSSPFERNIEMNHYYLSSPPGSGKTYSIVHKVRDLVERGDRVILCQPSVSLIEQTFGDFQEQAPNLYVKAIHGEPNPLLPNKSCKVMKQIRDYLKNPYYEGHVLIITWAAFQRLGFIPNKKTWHFIKDEIPQAMVCFDQSLPESHNIITDNLSLVSLPGKSYSMIRAVSDSSIRKIAENKKRDIFWNEFRDLASRIMSTHWKHFVITDQYEKLINKENGGRLTIFSVLKDTMFQGFKSVLIAGADYEESIFYYLFSKKHGVKFVEDKKSKKYLQYEKHPNGKLLDIYYAINGIWSKNLRDKDNRNILNKMKSGVVGLLPEKNFIWSGNKDLEKAHVFGPEMNEKLIPHSPHGLNSFTKHDNVVILSAYNAIPSFAKFMSDYLNISMDQVITALQRQTIYQAIMRGSLRDPKNTKRKIVFVPDLPSALWLQTKFEGSAIHFLDCGINIVMNKRGRKRVHGSGAERTKESRSRMKANIAAINKMLRPEYDYSSPIIENICNSNTIVIGNNVTKIRVYFFGAINEPLPIEYQDLNSVVEMENFLESRKKMKFASKEENRLFSLTKFDPTKSDLNYRGLDNVEYTYGILLDFDGGDMKPEDLARIFPELRMTIYSTYSSTKDNLKFRVYIPTSLKMDRETYCNITNNILYRIMENGYENHKKLAGSVSLSHGLDMTKMHPASLFYLPCQPPDKSGKYFQIFKGGERRELDVMRFIADSDEAGHLFQYEAGRLFQYEAGHCFRFDAGHWLRASGS
jgi:hypothetical protein